VVAAQEGGDFEILKGRSGGPLRSLSITPGPPLDGPAAVAGELVISSTGDLYMPLFYHPNPKRMEQISAAGLAVFKGGGWSLWRGELGSEGPGHLPDDWVNAVLLQDQTLFVATHAGLLRLKGEASRVFNENDFIDSEMILDLAIDVQGRIWAATMEGLGFLEGDQWHPVREGPQGRIFGLSVKGAQIWAVNEQGLWCQRRKRWRLQQLPELNAAIYDLSADLQGGLWILGIRGVLRLGETHCPD